MSNNYSNKRKLNDLEEEQIMERIRNGDKVSIRSYLQQIQFSIDCTNTNQHPPCSFISSTTVPLHRSRL